jgi:penicillin-binding protein 2
MDSRFSTLIPSMFHRRVLLLSAAVGLAFTPLILATARLALVRHEELLKEAELRLMRRQWTATTRGKILDRKGRVLTLDRPAYGVAVGYDVLAGRWVESAARKAAIRAHRHEWPDLGAARQQELLESYRVVFARHMAQSWSELAATVGVSEKELNDRRDAAVERIARAATRQLNRRRVAELDAAAERGDALTPKLMEEIEKRISKPIQEQTAPVMLLPKVSDDVGLRLQIAVGDEVELLPEGEGADAPRVKVPRFPGLRISDTGDREYPYDVVNVEIDRRTLPTPVRHDDVLSVRVEGVAAHILGRMRVRPYEQDIRKREERIKSDAAFAARVSTDSGVDRGELRDVDPVGEVGIEASFELELRGLRGVRSRRLDTGQEEEMPHVPGRDVTLTIDINLQARVQAAMQPQVGLAVAQPWHRGPTTPVNLTVPDGTALNGAAVVIDIETGDILAMVSTPSFSRAQLQGDPDQIFEDQINTPYLDRAIAKSYAAGSIVKPLILCGAAKRGVFQPGQTIECTGHFLPRQPNMYRCWIYKQTNGVLTHNMQLERSLSGKDALEVSCNIFFFTLGQRLGVSGVLDTYRMFGVGERFNLGVGLEFAGAMGGKGDGSDVNSGDAIQMGIGQGPISWTPLHAANAYATLARGGIAVPPALVRGVGGEMVGRGQPRDLEIPAWAIAEAYQGLEASVSGRHGTGNGIQTDPAPAPKESFFNAPNIMVWGKTGTATAPDLKVREAAAESGPDGEDDNEVGGKRGQTARVVRSGDHSWFLVLAGPKGGRMKYAIAVVMDYAGSGGKVSGPICNQIIHALIAEGYL